MIARIKAFLVRLLPARKPPPVVGHVKRRAQINTRHPKVSRPR